ncbi:hypothetical protein TNCV_2563331 [Trichonephila clavipes]|uniref:Uncharacterized protein n=1 Tax=Trichonephila clavipes TaxID=2585209 RepID=A0A8X6UYE4_TRICX|nr:hypothetical protein TNCV_2563331 [Trichonephila clavipes]
MSLGNGTRSVPPSISRLLLSQPNVASRRGFEIEDFLQYGFGGNVHNTQLLASLCGIAIEICCVSEWTQNGSVLGEHLFIGATETSRNITARDISGEIYSFLEDFRRFRTRQNGHQIGTNLVTKTDANLTLPPRFHQVLI